jgi:hypothetical protein
MNERKQKPQENQIANQIGLFDGPELGLGHR